MKIETTKTKKN